LTAPRKASQLDALRAAGYDEPRAAEILRAVFSYADGYATMELSSFCLDGASQAKARSLEHVGKSPHDPTSES